MKERLKTFLGIKETPINKDLLLDTEYDSLPTAIDVGIEGGDETAFCIWLPKTKGKEGKREVLEDDYVLRMDNGEYLDLPKLTRKEAIELTKKETGVNKYFDVVPRIYADHMGYKKTPDTRGLIDK